MDIFRAKLKINYMLYILTKAYISEFYFIQNIYIIYYYVSN